MEAEESFNEQQYLEAFNNGYLIAQYEPQLASKLAKQPNAENLYYKAIMAGKEQYNAETKEWLKSRTKGRQQTNIQNDLTNNNENKKLKR